MAGEVIAIWLVIWGLSRLVGSAAGKKASASGNPLMQPVRAGHIALGVYRLTILVFACVYATIVTPALLWESPRHLVVLLGLIILVLPWQVSRKVLIPLGWVRPAYYFAYLSITPWTRDRPGGAALCAAWALTRSRRHQEKKLRWLERKQPLRDLRAAGIMARGLVCATQGDMTAARFLIESVTRFNRRVRPPWVFRAAVEWLCLEAAEHGEWYRVEEVSGWLRLRSRTTWLLRSIARRTQGKAWPLTVRLWWLLAPRRRRTWPLVSQALAIDHTGATAGTPVVVDPDPSTLGQALSLHARAVAGPPTVVIWRQAVAAWSKVLSGHALQGLLARRIVALGARIDAEEAARRVRGQVERELAAAARQGRLRLDAESSESGLEDDIRLALIDEAMTEVEALAETIKKRGAEKRWLPIPEECRELAMLIGHAEQVGQLAGHDAYLWAIQAVHDALLNHSSRLYNLRGERAAANAIFYWLRSAAASLGHTELVELHEENLKCPL
jgi:hypothetical protein